MRVQNVLGVLGVAMATMVFTLMLLGPWNVGISKEAKGITPRIARPTFTSHGCEFTLKTGKPAYKPGESPLVEVTVVNPTSKAVEATVWVSMLSAEVPSRLSRVLTVPRPAWSKPWCVSLKPGETKTTRLTSAVKLAADQDVTITIGDKEQTIMVKELPVRRNEPLKKAAAAK
jgi:hypothetical protein